MGAPRVTVDQTERFWEAIRNNASQRTAARIAGISESTAKRLLKKPANGQDYARVREAREIPDTPVPLDKLCDAAQEALADRTGYLFCKRYAGWELSPFQRSVWQQCEEEWETPDRSFVCLNGPPGLGKSTSFVGFAAKQTALDRSIRGMFVSGAASLAMKNTRRVRMLLSRVGPMVGADSTMAADFGRFKPRSGGDVWRVDEFTVLQMDGDLVEEKEATWTAFGFDSNWIGNRLDLVFGDDLDSTRGIRNFSVVEGNREVFDNELEPRLEPGGLFILGQQRLGPHDFSNHVLQKRLLPEDDDGETEQPEATPKYRHIIYKVHYEEICESLPPEERKALHRVDGPAYPDGCLLDPRRMSWRDVRTAMEKPHTFKLVYQQEETDPEGVLVKPIWVKGGTDPETGVDHPGCWDPDRGLCELPRGLEPPLLSVVTVDPSDAQYWAFQWWVVQPSSQQRFLMDAVRKRMPAGELLDWDYNENRFTGIMEEWQRRSERLSFSLGLNVRISTWILEAVGAFKFLTAFSHSKRWKMLNDVGFIAQETHGNKHDLQMGVASTASNWEFGRVRLPGKTHDPGRVAAMKLVDEAQRYRTDGTPTGTDDQVDAYWFLEWNLPRLINGMNRTPVRQERPGFVKSSFSRQLRAV